LFSLNDDATVVPGTHLAQIDLMPKSLANRVAALEVKVGSKTIEEQFREQAELIDRVFAYRFEELDKKWDPRFAAMERALGVVHVDVSTLKGDVSTLNGDVSTLKGDVSALKDDVSTLKGDVSALKDDVSTLKGDVSILTGNVNNLQKDMVIVLEGVSILLKRLPN